MIEQEHVLKFDGINDYLELSHGCPTIETAITIEFLAKGRSGVTRKTTIFEAYNAQNNRVLNIHLPYWREVTDSRIVWDAGNQDGFDRLEKVVKIREYNIWVYWAFVKDSVSGKMYIYRNGEIWHQSEGNYKSLAGIEKLVIGSSVKGSNYWKGYLSEFRIWNKARTQTEIKQNLNRRLVGDELGLSVYLPFNGDANDHSSNGNHATIQGAIWMQRKIPIKVEQLPELGIDEDNESMSIIEEASKPEIQADTESISTIEQASEPEIQADTESISTIEETSKPEIQADTESISTIEETSKPEIQEDTESIIPMNNKKRLVVCCDGTWNEPISSYPSNVLKFARLVKYMADDKIPQLVFYSSGSSAEDADIIKRLGSNAFGWEIDKTIQDAYRFLCMNYDADAQDDIYLIGFSRGAYIVRALAGMIYKCGLLKRSKIREIPKAYQMYRDAEIGLDDAKAQEFRQENSQKIQTEKDYLEYRVPIKMLGCWETLGALGIPDFLPWLPIDKIWNKKYEFSDSTLSPIIENAFNAVAIDEKRKAFSSTPMEKNPQNPRQELEEVWFAGNHICIGGGVKEYQGLSDYPLQWMLHKAGKLGLQFYLTENTEEEFQMKPDCTTQFDNSIKGVDILGGEAWRTIESPHVFIHHSVVQRLKACPEYRPENLDPLLQDLLPPDFENQAQTAENVASENE